MNKAFWKFCLNL